jgi:hypothetical protein
LPTDALSAAHAVAAHFDPGSYGVAIIPAIASFVPGRRGVRGDEAKAWASELNDLGNRREFYFAGLHFSFLGTRPPQRPGRPVIANHVPVLRGVRQRPADARPSASKGRRPAGCRPISSSAQIVLYGAAPWRPARSEVGVHSG